MSGISTEPLISDSIGGMLRRQAALYPKQPFQLFPQHKVEYSYAEFDQKVDEIAKGLIALGLKTGDRVGIYSPNRPEWALVQYACSRADLILVNINPAFQVDDLKYSLNQVEVKVLVMPESFSHSNYVDIVRHLVPHLGHDNTTNVQSKEVPNLEKIVVCGHKKHKGMISFDDLYRIYSINDKEELKRREDNIDFESATNIQFTSGTTGYPKGATLSHHNILNNGKMLGSIMEYDSNSKICICVPLYHCFGMVMGSLAALNYGSAAVYPWEGFKPKEALKAIKQYKCDTLYGVPSMFNNILKEYRDNKDIYDVASLSKGVMAGSIWPEELMKICNKILGIKFLSIAYGMTETSPITFQTRKTDSFEKQITTIGKVHPHVEAKIVDQDGKTMKIGEKGEIWTRGYWVMIKYWNDEEKTKKTIDDQGWVHTGDLGVMDEEGYLEITGRVKDMIIRGGENIFPKEIENHLLTHKDILDAQVIGVNDEVMGEEVMAYIILNDPDKILSRNDVYEFWHGHIAHYKIPKYIKLVKEYPLTVTGKVSAKYFEANIFFTG